MFHAGTIQIDVALKTSSELRVSVLDQAPIPEGSTATEALRNTIELARAADKLGFHRYWLAEHHGTPALACVSPEALIGPVAAATFSLLEALYPGRIDLGIGRAAGTSPAVTFALQRDRRQPVADDFYEHLLELLGYIDFRPLEQAPISRIAAGFHFERPEPWLLGSSEQSAIWAAELGLPYVFADFINPNGARIAGYYKHRFSPSASITAPKAAVAVWAICAATNEEAEQLSLSGRMMLTMLQRGHLIPVPTVERARQFFQTEGMQPHEFLLNRRFVTGTPDRVRLELEELARSYGAEEVFVVNILHDQAAQRRSYEFLAQAFELTAGPRELEPVTVRA
jgi:luciferase family oxidoreductase group 1